MSTRLAIYGIGNFGYAWVKHFDAMSDDSIEVVAYDRDPTVVESLRSSRTHPFLHKGVTLSDRVTFASTPEELVSGADVVLLSVTSDATREVISSMCPHLSDGVTLVNTAKALDNKTGAPLSTIVSESMGDTPYTYALLSGGTIAADLFAQEPLGIDLACADTTCASDLVTLFTSSNLRVYQSQDLSGVEYAGALKNVIAILAGIIHGMGFSYGSETHVISRCAGEIQDLVTTHLGGSPATFDMSSQCWGNDLWMSCTGNTRNRAFGVLLGQGKSISQALAEMAAQHKTVEGVRTIAVLDTLEGISNYPLLHFLYQYIEKESVDLSHLKTLIFEDSY
jgi:glycerol-3-phosphate dehydrogenase (NAD(P)+)